MLTVSLAIAAGLSSWQHASIGSEIIDHLQREEEAAARRLKRAAAARVLRRPQILATVRTEELEMPSQAPDLDWPAAPDMDWQDAGRGSAGAERREAGEASRTRRAGGKREKPEKREKGSGGLVGAAAARGALALASLPGKFRRSEKKAAKVDSDSDDDSGPGPGAGGESAGPISDITFTPPVRIQRKFP